MTLRSKLASFTGKSALWALKTFTQGGSSLPGKIALTIDPQVLESLSQEYDVAIITGTNGKTLTTALSVAILKQKYPQVLTNSTGSNMQQGIVSAFLSQKSLTKGQKGLAILEVDEGSLKHVVPYLKPKVFVHTNIFRDQMDRYGEIDSIYQLLVDAAKMAPEATVIANGDSPILNSADLPNSRLFYGFNHLDDSDQKVSPAPNTDGILCPYCQSILEYKSITYANLGNYYCPDCDFKRPELDFSVTQLNDLTIDQSSFEIDGHYFTIPVAGTYNIYNALAAYSLGRFFGLRPEEIASGFSQAQRVFGRQENLIVEGRKVLINLVKNPVGLNQVIDIVGLDKNPVTLIAILNNDYADGTDVSWIWDGEFEKLADYDIRQSYVSGSRSEDMYQRLKVAGLDTNNMEQFPNDMEAVVEAIKSAPTEHVHILATYTAMLQLRKTLMAQSYLQG